MPLLRLRLFVLGLLAALLLSACGPSPYAVSDEARTPLPAVASPAPPPPTSTAAPTVVVVIELPEVKQARQLSAERQFDQAISILNGVYGRFRDDPTLRELLAATYRDWGADLIDGAGGSPEQVSAGLGHFVSGLAVAPADGAAFTDLTARQQQAEGFLALLERVEALDTAVAAAEEVDAELRAEADEVAALAGDLRQRDGAFAGLDALFVRALLLVGETYASSRGASREEQVAFATSRRDACALALEVDLQNADATACRDDADSAITVLLTSPTRVPPPPPPPDPCGGQGCLRMSVLNYNDTPTCVSVQITRIDTTGWRLTIDGLRLEASFGGGDARVCGLGSGQQVTITVRNASGQPVRGGAGVPSKGSAIMLGEWR